MVVSAADLAAEPAAGSNPSAEFSTAASAEPAAAITSSAEPAAPEPTRARVQHVHGILRVVRTDETGERYQAELH